MTYPQEIRDERIGNLNLRIVGVKHNEGFFREHESFFRREISKTNFVFLEDGNSLTSGGFYKYLADIVGEKNQSVYVPDSANIGHLLCDMAVSGTGAYLFLKSLEEPTLRREFVRKGLMAVGGLYLATGLFGLRETALQDVVGPEGTLDNKLAYDAVQDFRNIVSAENFERAEKYLGIRGDATYFIGSAHVNGLHAYIRNPELRQKRILYLPQELFTDSKIKEYQKIDGNWKVVRKV